MKKNEENNGWVYVCDERFPENEQITGVRYVLGQVFDPSKSKALICVGINPSTAMPGKLDMTLNKVRKYAEESGEYGAWYMINVYPQRATDPNGMHSNDKCSHQMHERNLIEVKALLDSVPEADVWCAWGNNIGRRKYLPDMLYGNAEEGITGLLSLFGAGHVLKAHHTTNDGHPAHPLARIPISRLKELGHFSNLNDRLKRAISNE